MTHTPKNMLVTGGAGFIGANYVRYELMHDPLISIVTLDKLTYAGNRQNLDGLDDYRHTFIQGDICDAALVSKILFEYHIDTIVHFAAESHVDRSIDHPQTFVETNVLGTCNLLQQAKEAWLNNKNVIPENCRFHHISTDEVYGSLQKNDPSFTESHCYKPNSPYAASKAAADHLVRAFGHTYGLPITISSCSNNYGPYQHAEKLIPTIINACYNQKEIPIYGDGSNIRDWIFVEDHCDAVAHIVREGVLNETYNVGGQCEMSNIDIATLICDIMNARFPSEGSHINLLRFVKDRLGHDWRYSVDNQKIRERLGWKQKTSLKEGLEKTVAFVIQQNFMVDILQ